jgi:molybdenum cofactor sulfurtransferase
MISHKHLFGTMEDVSSHTSWLAEILYHRLVHFRHGNGAEVFRIYKASTSTYGDATTQGATLAMNIRRHNGSWMSSYEVGVILRRRNIHVRTGSLCNPAGMANALDLSADDIRGAYDAGFRCNQQDEVRGNGKIFGVVRITLGAMSTLQDINALLRCFEELLVQKESDGRKIHGFQHRVLIRLTEKLR